MKTHKLLSACVFALGATLPLMAASQASAGTITPIYVGTATLEGLIDRQLFSCYGVPVTQSGPSESPALTYPATSTTTCPSAPVNAGVEFLTANTTTGPIQLAYLNNDPAGQGLTASISAATNPVPYTSPDFPDTTWGDLTRNYQFGDTISPLSSTQLTTYQTAAVSHLGGATVQSVMGPALQFPVMEAGITLPFNPNLQGGGKLNIKRPVPKGGSTGLSLSRQSYCGIFSGAITDWSDPSLTADNKGVPLAASGNTIIVVYRTEKVSTSQQLMTHLQTVCATTKYPFNFTPSQTWASTGPTASNGHPNFIATPPSQGGIAGMVDTVGDGSAQFPGNPGSIGYAGADYVLPISATQNPTVAQVPAANLQNPNQSTTAFLPPTAANFSHALATATPPTGSAITNPANWGAVVYNPAKGYPISGFVFVQTYTCFQPSNLAALTGYFKWFLGSEAAKILTADGFAKLPGPWHTAVSNLVLKTASTKIRAAGAAGICSDGA